MTFNEVASSVKHKSIEQTTRQRTEISSYKKSNKKTKEYQKLRKELKHEKNIYSNYQRRTK